MIYLRKYLKLATPCQRWWLQSWSAASVLALHQLSLYTCQQSKVTPCKRHGQVTLLNQSLSATHSKSPLLICLSDMSAPQLLVLGSLLDDAHGVVLALQQSQAEPLQHSGINSFQCSEHASNIMSAGDKLQRTGSTGLIMPGPLCSPLHPAYLCKYVCTLHTHMGTQKGHTVAPGPNADNVAD